MTTATAQETRQYIMPRVNIVEEPEQVRIEAELAGVEKDKVELEVKDGELTLAARRASTSGKGVYLLRERTPADYRRVFALSKAIDTANINATMKDGVVTITLPKVQAYQPRTIQVK
ncbi:MAG TPA: Hsp20/alpha crystallin family protein [Candidatus Hydrogenedentes bacterium]|jgi:HSP20 family molecular chaperone IbpA|nr:Hsp20/alpha crystallin family protein [Candidatus Hydrogenedentota bacterium]MDY0032946.1 Hsp20/alpha crystallin family protein [FCB group bacterium]NLT59121.1 Hsp20/alpha crystallin family protein [Candidatus Hydrogenedentota bacterium]HNV21224.1 Hsp20/alpha crystallin family protein [Candidatus Hydrogenedentota bacterium]HNZ17907.1 Hsp20/alpha crystallin family protein [Candidatus Hydrogenedentota bacterium]